MENKVADVCRKEGEVSKGMMVVVNVGESVVLESGVWDFTPNQDEMCNCVMLTLTIRYEELVGMVNEKFQISLTKFVNLSKRLHEVMVMGDAEITLSASITSDDDVNVFEAIFNHIEK
ncbi:hypothetical protein AALP_AA8G278400 [Arabis alpina]|uniref:Uncharacterized protein n=1 Tax=Arabis alpina TaxID=50452 RepID=A0A087G9X3_ARAAL|nr:hypothetical protein AALP_AA8G278400 [Arabis alpina]